MTSASQASELLVDLARPLVNHVLQRLRYYEAIGDVEPGDLTPEDVIGTVYLEAGEQLRYRRRGQHGYRWLRRLADRILRREISRLRTARRAAGRRDRVAAAPGLSSLIPDPNAPIPDAVAESLELQRALARILGELPDDFREPLMLMACQGYSLEEVAAMEGIQPATAARRVAKATAMLRERLQEEYGDVEPLSPEQILPLIDQATPTATITAHAREQLHAP